MTNRASQNAVQFVFFYNITSNVFIAQLSMLRMSEPAGNSRHLYCIRVDTDIALQCSGGSATTRIVLSQNSVKFEKRKVNYQNFILLSISCFVLF